MGAMEGNDVDDMKNTAFDEEYKTIKEEVKTPKK